MHQSFILICDVRTQELESMGLYMHERPIQGEYSQKVIALK